MTTNQFGDQSVNYFAKMTVVILEVTLKVLTVGINAQLVDSVNSMCRSPK